jgi:hypothetical protein
VTSGRGMAFIHYKHNESFVAVGMVVQVHRDTGEILVQRVACAHYCGLMINPTACAHRSKATSCRRCRVPFTRKPLSTVLGSPASTGAVIRRGRIRPGARSPGQLSLRCDRLAPA